MDNEEKLIQCIVPSPELRVLLPDGGYGSSIRKIQQRFYNYDGTEFVWRTVPHMVVSLQEFQKNHHFE